MAASPRVCVASGGDEVRYRSYVNHKVFAGLHGFTHHIGIGLAPGVDTVYYYKFELVREILPHFDWVLYLDDDVYVTDLQSRTVEELIAEATDNDAFLVLAEGPREPDDRSCSSRHVCAACDGFGMNYRHAYHAGGFTDVTKHTVLALVIAALKKKDSPFFVLGMGLACPDTSGATHAYTPTSSTNAGTTRNAMRFMRFLLLQTGKCDECDRTLPDFRSAQS